MNPSEFIKKKAAEWFTKAESDLRTAEILLADPDPPTDTASYHCQQSLEKYLKGILTFYQIDFIKSHDLDYLSKLVSQKLDLGNYLEAILSLNKYAIEARYPSDIPIFYPVEEAKKALETAKEIIRFIKTKLARLI
ncbi:MAG: HEPN domain-containing protein [Candidatus Saganbacteria bacterium]|nr:HEPN domain-containing protein [Candidatus Saganbacteria bacterium]